MIVARLRRALERLQPRYLPQSALGQAIQYALNQWSQLAGFLEHGEVEIDNNLVENAIRPTALARRTGSSLALEINNSSVLSSGFHRVVPFAVKV